MKVEVKQKFSEIKYPCLMKEYEFGTIVLFNKKQRKGVYKNSNY